MFPVWSLNFGASVDLESSQTLGIDGLVGELYLGATHVPTNLVKSFASLLFVIIGQGHHGPAKHQTRDFNA